MNKKYRPFGLRLKSLNRNITSDNNSQMLTLLGMILVISIISLTAFSANLSNIDAMIPIERSSSVWNEYLNIKEDFQTALTYNFANVIIQTNKTSVFVLFYGNYSNFSYEINKAFDKTVDSFYLLALQHGIFFNAELIDYWYITYTTSGPQYEVYYNLYINGGKTSISENITYRFSCFDESMGSADGGTWPGGSGSSGWGLDQSYETYDNDYRTFTGSRYYAQSFVPTKTNLDKIELYLKKDGAPPVLTMYICDNTSAEPDPSNIIVTMNMLNADVKTAYNWVEFNFTDQSVTAGNTYYIVIYASGGDAANQYYWGGDRMGSTYSNGELWASFNSGSTWNLDDTSDACFRTYGYD